MSDDMSLLEWGFKGLVGTVLTIGGWLWVMLIRAVSKNRDEITNHKLHVAETYVKKDVVDRIHDRIDEIGEKMDDMKTLLITKMRSKP